LLNGYLAKNSQSDRKAETALLIEGYIVRCKAAAEFIQKGTVAKVTYYAGNVSGKPYQEP